MSEKPEIKPEMITVQSSRFGELEVPLDTIIEFPSGLIGFQRAQRFVMIEHKTPFSWLHSVEDPTLAFVVVDGFEFGKSYDIKAPIGDKDIDLHEEDEYAILVIVTARPDPKLTTANLKAPIFVNIRNRKGLQIIFDDQRFSTRHPLWQGDSEGDSDKEGANKEDASKK